MKELTDKETNDMMTTVEMCDRLSRHIGRAPGTTRHLLMAITKPAGFRIDKGKHTYFWHKNQLKSLIQHFKENPPAGRGRPKKEKK